MASRSAGSWSSAVFLLTVSYWPMSRRLSPTSNSLMSVETILSGVSAGRASKSAMPKAMGSRPRSAEISETNARSRSVAVGLLSITVSVSMAASRHLFCSLVGSTP